MDYILRSMHSVDGLDPVREWTFCDCDVGKFSWGFRVWALGGHCDIVYSNGDRMEADEEALDRGESPIAYGWEDGCGHDVHFECERTAEEESS